MPYIEKHKNSGFKIWDKVTVTRKADSYAHGWDTVWRPQMDTYVGSTHVITGDLGTIGFCLDYDCYFPYFVLVPAVFDFIGEG